MNRLKDYLYRFFAGRYGTDSLNKLLLWIYIALVAVNLFFRNKIISALYFLVAIFLILRMLSKDIYSRQRENEKYLLLRGKLVRQFNFRKNRWKLRKTHIYKKCPYCKTVVRLPRKNGKLICTCPSCRKEFEVKCRKLF